MVCFGLDRPLLPMPPTATGSSLVTRTRVPQASASGRPLSVGSDGLPLLPCHDAPVVMAPPPAPCPTAVTLFGHVDTTQNVRTQLLAHFSRTQQLNQVSEMTLRIDTEMELLRRKCFAERNALWGNVTPDQFEFKPTPSDAWTPHPANDKLLLRKMKMHGAFDGSGREFYPPETTHEKDLDVVEYVRDRPWPPQEFALKPVAKTSRGRIGKRKAAPMAAILEPLPLLAKTCRECKTQSTPLWRTQTRTVKTKKQVVKNVAMNNVAMNLANSFMAQNMATLKPLMTEMRVVNENVVVDVCLECYLKLERADLFDKKRVELKRRKRSKKSVSASAALSEKKRSRHPIHGLKKQKKQEISEANEAAAVDQGHENGAASGAVVLNLTQEEIEAAKGSSRDRKKDRNHRQKDKKKKKKHRRKRDHLDESESDNLSLNALPASLEEVVPAYQYTMPQTSAVEMNADRHVEVLAPDEPEAGDSAFEEELLAPARFSSRKRRSVQYTESPVVADAPASALKNRKASSSSRTARSKRTSTSVAPAPATTSVPPVSSVKKRSRSKKELARERELRALGQYCPVCNEVYEDDDPNTFVCCDSCELWVHGTCDSSLTAESIAAMANTEDKYICPLCAGR
ncbi:hypothetical protein CCR75_004560 [Bremia lactucae]|uniref:PHD-type domain-containing protein n=1 Tax=Bremia lactucae TaxID=4779 RepID=A0A976IIN2_BRELC|nr:hypothetical protein CCR75_004560 [Bremia lactucae]